MRKFYRSRTNRMISGLCGGLGETLNVDVTLIRILAVVLTLFSSGTTILIYFIVSLIVPKSPDIYNPYQSGPNYRNPNQFHRPNQSHYTGERPEHSQYASQRQWQSPPQQPTDKSYSNVDSMMDDLEKKALRNEIEMLKKKLNEVEKKGE